MTDAFLGSLSLLRLTFILGALIEMGCYGDEPPPKPTAAISQTPIDKVELRPLVKADGLATVKYEPSERERLFYSKLDADQIATGGLATAYNISEQRGKYVGWFGIVRAIREQNETQRTELTVEHKYFDGFTDSHIQALSFNGSGDFVAVLRGVDLDIEPLTLIKVYGDTDGPTA